MIVYIYNEAFLNRVFLPTKVNGVYSLFTEEHVFLANIEEQDGNWVVNKTDEVFLFENDVEQSKLQLREYSMCSVKSTVTGKVYYLFCSPIYDSNVYNVVSLKSDLTIGSSYDCDISIANGVSIQNAMMLSYQSDGKWLLDTKGNVAFVNEMLVQRKLLFFGDYIFFWGLRIFAIGNHLIINNPNNCVKIKSDSFSLYPKEKAMTEVLQERNVVIDLPLFSKDDYFYKAPRFTSVLNTEKVVIDEPPPPIEKQQASLLMTIGPQITMISTSAITLFSYITDFLAGKTDPRRFYISLATIGVTMTGTLLWPTLTRVLNNRREKKLEKKRRQKYLAYLKEKQNKIEVLKNQQRQVLLENNLSLENCALVIQNRSRNLWERSIGNSDFLEIRLGMGVIESKIEVDEPSDKFTIEDKDAMLVHLENTVAAAKYIDDAPLCVSLAERYLLAIIGQEELCHRFMESVFLQIMTFYSYTDLKIVVFTNHNNAKYWDYVKILPHCWDNPRTIRYFSTSIEEANSLSMELEKAFDNRLNDSEEEKIEEDGSEVTPDAQKYVQFKPYYLVFTDDIMVMRNVPIIKKIMNYKKNIGFSLLVLNDRLSTLPNEISNFVNISLPKSGLITNELTVGNQREFVAQFNEGIDIYECSSRLANIPIQVEKAKYELPSSLSFLEMYQVGKVEQLNSLERWKNNNPVNSLSVPVGIDQNGELFKMDLHEKAYGPHGLIAGTTGSGKSEWIVTLILSLAVNFNPDEVQFVIIDYKGGGLAMSFENSELGVKLPHLAGTITNLDKSEINRCISSIESELKRRQSIFNDAREKLKESSMNIYKYQQAYRKGLVDKPLSHLLIICDEFAELKQQQPEFMEQLISTSRIGRSLGVHLLLATQKPSGVVNDQIWSNSRFKVSLRVQDVSDSNEILKKPDAAYLKQTGAFYLMVGNDEYYNLGQSAWAGAKYYPSDVIKKKIDESVQCIDNAGHVVNYYDDGQDKSAVQESHGEELLNVISYLDHISKQEDFVRTQLWLPNVAKFIILEDVKKRYSFMRKPWDFHTAIGEYDEPRKQEQGLLTLDLEAGSIAIFGQNGSGKEKLITTILWSSMIDHTPQELNYYIIDFGAETMKMFAKFPHVGEVVFQDEMDKVGGILDLVMEEIENRKTLFMDYNGSYDFYIKNSGNYLPLIGVVINGFDVFSEVLPQLGDVMNSLFRDSVRYGIFFIASVSSNTGLRARQLQYFNHTIVLQMANDTTYRELTNCRRGLIPGKGVGRGICKIADTDDSYCEFQTASICDDQSLVKLIRSTSTKLADYYKVKAKQLATIPDTVSSEDMLKYATDLSTVPIGYDFYEKSVTKYNLLANKIHLFTTRDLRSNMPFVYAFISLVSKMQGIKVRVIDMLNVFKLPILDIKLFQENFEVVFAALEKDVLERTEAQDYAVTIILGMGGFKNHLNKGGLEIVDNLFKNIVASKKGIFVLIDTYEQLRTLKLESWFNQIDVTSGLWLGTGLQSQSLFAVSPVRDEDRKYDFEGMAYKIDDGQYELIKTMMDGDE